MNNHIEIRSIGVRSCGVSSKSSMPNVQCSMLNVQSSMSRRPYAAPCTEVILPDEHPVMVKASPGIGGPWNPGDDIDAKGFDALDYLPTEFNNPWGE